MKHIWLDREKYSHLQIYYPPHRIRNCLELTEVILACCCKVTKA